MKRFFTLTLMLFCFILHNFAFDYTDENGVTWTCSAYDESFAKLTGASNYGEEVVVPEKVYDGETAYTVKYLNDTFKDSEVITKVTLPKHATEIYDAFCNCHNLTEVINSQYITKCISRAFESTSLISIDLSNCEYVGGFINNKKLRTVILKACKIIDREAFSNCPNLVSVGETASVTSIDYGAFYHCESLTSIDLSNCSSWSEISTFQGCKSLKEVKFSKTLTEIPDYSFWGCIELTNFDFSNITKIGESAFKETGLKELILPATIKQIPKSAFENCNNLTKVDLTNVITISESAFEGSGIKELILPETIKQIPSCAFKNCINLTKLELTNVITINESAFEGTGLEELTLPAAKQIAKYAFKDCSKLTKVDLANVTTIGESAFEGTDLKELILPTTVTSIGRNAFSAPEYITINATNVPALDGTFGNNTIVLVPENALNAYKTANVWKDFANQVFAIGTKLDYEVKTIAQDKAPGLLQQLDKNNLNNIVSLKVSGTINGYDIMLFRNKMDNLHHLDLSDADIVANPYEYYQGNCTQDSILGDNSFSKLDKLFTVKLPNSVKQINMAFNECKNLTSVVLPEKLISLEGSFHHCDKLREVKFKACKEIGNSSFGWCDSLNNVYIPKGVKKIDTFAFISCISLDNITLPEGVTYIGYQTFSNCKFSTIILPEGLEVIDHAAFHGDSYLKKVEFPSTLKRIEYDAFMNCTSLDSISLPGLNSIGREAFSGCTNLKELRVPSTLEKIEDGAFSGCNLEKIYAYTVLPISISQNTFDNFSNISLYVPTQSVDNYYLNTQWSQFKEIHEFNEPYKYFYLDKEFTLEDKRFDGTPDIDIKEDGGLKVDGKDNQEAGDVTIKGDGDKGNSGTLITDGNLNAKKMRFDISVSDNKWYFFSFPFDIKLSDTKAPGEYKWKMYDGSIRADQGSGGWVNLPDNEEWLKQGKGYIFQTNKAGTLTLKVTKEKFGQLDANNIMKELDVFPSGNNFDASWNFIGNPQTSYYNVNDLGYEAPITVWNGNSYEAVRPGDDDYTLHPFQAFFVQKPTASSTIEFKAEDRLTKTGSEIRAQETKARRLARGFVPSRMIINLNVSDGSLSDKTRVVFNDKKSRNYEMDCDAAKFMTLTQAPQLYSVEGKGTKFAINERPMGSVQLGFTAKKSGTFTISAVRMDQPMLLKDNVAGITIDLTNGDYEFTSEAGTFNKRFLLTPNSSVTSIADVVKKTGVNILPTEEGIQINGCNGKNVDVYNLNGAQVASSNSDGMLRLSAGVYIVKVNGMSTKVMVK